MRVQCYGQFPEARSGHVSVQYHVCTNLPIDFYLFIQYNCSESVTHIPQKISDAIIPASFQSLLLLNYLTLIALQM